MHSLQQILRSCISDFEFLCCGRYNTRRIRRRCKLDRIFQNVRVKLLRLVGLIRLLSAFLIRLILLAEGCQRRCDLLLRCRRIFQRIFRRDHRRRQSGCRLVITVLQIIVCDDLSDLCEKSAQSAAVYRLVHFHFTHAVISRISRHALHLHITCGRRRIQRHICDGRRIAAHLLHRLPLCSVCGYLNVKSPCGILAFPCQDHSAHLPFLTEVDHQIVAVIV